MKCNTLIMLAITALAGFSLQATAEINLGTSGDFAVLAGSTVTNTGSSVIEGGNVGVSAGTEIIGFPPAIIVGPFTTHAADAVAAQAQVDLTTAYNAAAALPFTQDLTGLNLGGQTLTPGVYFFSTTAQLTGTLTLDAQNDPTAEFIFQIGSTLTTASGALVNMTNQGTGLNVFWQVGSSATLGTSTEFSGNILADQSITLNTGANITDGRALARIGAVTLDGNHIIVPEPATMALVLVGVVGLLRARSGKKAS